MVNEGVTQANYAIALIFFKELFGECDVLNISEKNEQIIEKYKSDIKIAIALLDRANIMEPARSFLIGIVGSYNIGECAQYVLLGYKFWEDYLVKSVAIAESCGYLRIEPVIIKFIDNRKTWKRHNCGLGIKHKQEFVNEIGSKALLELALNMCSETYFDIPLLLLDFLHKQKCPKALYNTSIALLQNKFSVEREYTSSHRMPSSRNIRRT